MAAPSLLDFRAMTSLAAAACQTACTKALKLSVGSVTRVILEAAGSVGLWLQYRGVLVYRGTRLSTSSTSDVDSFVGDFGISRIVGVKASGGVTFSRRTSFLAAVIAPYWMTDGSVNPTGVQVVTADRSQTFGVVADTQHILWNVGQGAYVLPINTFTATIQVQALAAGTAGNVQAVSITATALAVANIDTVSNPSPFSNGVDGETDDELRARFALYVATRARATRTAIATAITAVQQDLSYAVAENTLPVGLPRTGFFTITVDDGTGSPPATLLSAVYASVDQARPLGVLFTVQPPAVIQAVVNMTISAASGYSKSSLQAQVASTILTFINSLGIGQALSYTRLSALAFSIPGVSNVSNLLLNGSSFDIGGGPTQVVKASASNVVVN